MASLWLPAASVSLIALAVWGAGSLFTSRLRSPTETTTDSLPVWIWGLAAWTTTLFLLASGGLYRVPVVVTLVVLLALVGTMYLVWHLRRRHQAETPSTTLHWAPTLLFCLPLVFVYAITVNPTISWDAAVYHLTLPDLYLREGGFRVIPFLVYGVWPQAVELLFGAALALQDHASAKALHFGFGILVAVTLFRDAVLRNTPQSKDEQTSCSSAGLIAGTVAAALFLLNDVVLFEMRAAYVDLALAFFALAAFLFLDRWLENEETNRFLLLSAGLACGLLAGSKINGAVTAGCVAALLLPRLLSQLASRAPADRKAALRTTLCFALPIAIMWTPWLLRSWAVTGNPVYPLLWEVFGGPDWNARLGEQLFAWQRSIGMGREPLDYLLLPWRIFTAGDSGYEHFDGRLSPLWLPFLPLALWRATSSARCRRALGVSALVFATWAAGSQQMRFLIPALPLLALAVGDGVASLVSHPALRRRLESKGRVGGIAGLAVPGLVALAWITVFGVVQGRLVQAGWNHLKLYADPRFERPGDPPRSPAFETVAHLTGNPSVLLLNSNHIYHCRPNICWANSFFEAPQIDDWLGSAASADEVAQRLRKRGISFVAWAGAPRFRHAQPILDLLARPDLARPVALQGPDRRTPDRLWKLTSPAPPVPES